MNFSIDSLKVNAFDIDSAKSQVIVNSNNTLTMELMIPTFKLDFKFGMDGLSHWIIGNGNGHMYLTNFGFKATLGLGLKSGKMNVTIDYIELDLANNTVDFFIDGSNDWIKLVNISVGAGLPYLIKEVGGAMAPSLMNQLANAINGLLTSTPSITNVTEHLFVNYGILAGLSTMSQYVMFGLNGTIYTDNVVIPVVYPTNPVALPNVVLGAGDMQMIISQNVILCGMYAMYSQNIMNIAVTSITPTIPINSQFIAVFIPEVIGMYNPSTQGKIFLNITAPPTFSISQDLITLGTVADSVITIGEAANKLVTEVSLNIQFQMEFAANNGMLQGSIKGYTFTLAIVKSGTGINPNQASLNQLFNTVLKFALPQINDILSVGFALPSYAGLTFKESRIIEGDKYLVVGTSPKPSKQTTKMVIEGINNINYDLLLDEFKDSLGKAIGKTILLGF